MPERTVGSKKLGPNSGNLFPPTSNVAPFPVASSMCPSAFVTARPWIKGPWVGDASFVSGTDSKLFHLGHKSLDECGINLFVNVNPIGAGTSLSRTFKLALYGTGGGGVEVLDVVKDDKGGIPTEFEGEFFGVSTPIETSRSCRLGWIQ